MLLEYQVQLEISKLYHAYCHSYLAYMNMYTQSSYIDVEKPFGAAELSKPGANAEDQPARATGHGVLEAGPGNERRWRPRVSLQDA